MFFYISKEKFQILFFIFLHYINNTIFPQWVWTKNLLRELNCSKNIKAVYSHFNCWKSCDENLLYRKEARRLTCLHPPKIYQFHKIHQWSTSISFILTYEWLPSPPSTFLATKLLFVPKFFSLKYWCTIFESKLNK